MQLRVLEELFRKGTETPSTSQIQKITSQLRRYGNVEGKNVFYWFQNHKARERRKRRRAGNIEESASSSAQGLSKAKETNCSCGELTEDQESERKDNERRNMDYLQIISSINTAATTSSVASKITQKIIQLPSSSSISPQLNCKENEDDNEDPRTLELFPLNKKDDVGEEDNNKGLISLSESKSKKFCANEEEVSYHQFF
ncbi:hypothetical protein PIB30_019094 [Stylosanthes scabra]|uniref:Homeobox domain-containing protein n=1 Tax=Stylosanthes scabra TaxID=79078 RepID=A0ABU6U8C9_9FABA|nr:hypothetical protein [Stylosanthes scabra]